MYVYIARGHGITTRDNVAEFWYIIMCMGLDGDVLDGRLQVQYFIIYI